LIQNKNIFRKEGGTLRQMNTEKLLKTIPTLQNQLDALLDFEVTPADLNNGVINCAFMLLFRDLIRLFACYNDGIINLLGKAKKKLLLRSANSFFIHLKFLVEILKLIPD
jgi:hypothetical protein